MTRPTAPDIKVQNLTYTFPTTTQGLHNVSLSLPAGSRTLLLGANGAGKTTLLRLLAGKRLAPGDTILIANQDPFKSNLVGITYLGTEWVLNPIVRSDIDVPSLLASVGGNAYPERRDELVNVLDIDLRWRMHAVSDGERRRVQLAMGLLRPWEVLLLDEVTVDLDLLSRKRFLNWLRSETEKRGVTVVYATHILDGVAGWATHLVHTAMGQVKGWGSVEEVWNSERERWRKEGKGEVNVGGGEEGNSKLSELVLRWLEEDLEERGPREHMKDKPPENRGEAGFGGYGFESRRKNDD